MWFAHVSVSLWVVTCADFLRHSGGCTQPSPFLVGALRSGCKVDVTTGLIWTSLYSFFQTQGQEAERVINTILRILDFTLQMCRRWITELNLLNKKLKFDIWFCLTSSNTVFRVFSIGGKTWKIWGCHFCKYLFMILIDKLFCYISYSMYSAFVQAVSISQSSFGLPENYRCLNSKMEIVWGDL